MSLDDGLTSVQKASKKKEKRRKTIMVIKFVTPPRVLLFSIQFPLNFFISFFNITRSRMWVDFPPFRDLGVGGCHSTVPSF